MGVVFWRLRQNPQSHRVFWFQTHKTTVILAVRLAVSTFKRERHANLGFTLTSHEWFVKLRSRRIFRMKTILVLEDDDERRAGFQKAVAGLGGDFELKIRRDAPAMVAECEKYFPTAVQS